jgi:hypothetical protein
MGNNIHGLMPHNDGYPGLSRDWADIECKNTNCMHQRFDRCTVPSLAKINEEGRCTGFVIKDILKDGIKTKDA